ncbi:hypothetical protein OS493_001473 [Desmophyllum pertusum]|uniref:Uncharacterized protein n=1 Tax=Desmophyllum pertusum TaxID=174260 RepID=A0A9W9ZGJ4_9CNID|nr:hypothetical protein OS493_001473 [Desmophyllum pertusum]
MLQILGNVLERRRPTLFNEPTCNVKYHKLGCYKDRAKAPTLLEKLILTDRDPTSPAFSKISIDWGNWDSHLPSLACRCAQKAAENKYAYFGLQYYGECWSSPEAGETYNQAGPAIEGSCVTNGYQPCPKDPKATEKECVGKRNVNYVYTIENTKIHGVQFRSHLLAASKIS